MVKKEVVHGIYSVQRTAPARGYKTGAYLVFQKPGIHITHNRRPLQEGLHIGRYVRRIDGRAQKDSVSRFHFFKYALEIVLLMDTVFFATAGKTLPAGLDSISRKLHCLCLDSGGM